MNATSIKEFLEKYQLLLKVVVGSALLVFLLLEAASPIDFEIFLKASADLLAHKDIYKVNYNNGYRYYYDVSFALLLSPFLLLPIYVATFIWLTLNLFFAYRIWKIVSGFLPFEKINYFDGFKKVFNLIVMLSIFSLWHRNMHLSQMTILLLYLCLEGVLFIMRKKILHGSLLLAFGVTVKVMPLVVLPYLLYRGQFKAFGMVVFAVVGFLFLPALFIGYQYNNELLHSRWELINPTNSEHVIDLAEESFHSMTSLIPALLMEDAAYKKTVDRKRNIVDVSEETMSWILNGCRFVLVFLILLFLRPGPFKSFGNDIQVLYELSYLMLVTPLIFPHQQHYAYFMLLPAISYLTYYFLVMFNLGVFSKRKKIMLLLFFALIYILLNSHFLVGAYRDYYDYFKTLTYGVLLLVPLLIWCKPEKLSAKMISST